MRGMILISLVCGATMAAAQGTDIAHHRAVLEAMVERAQSFELPEGIEVVFEQSEPPPTLSEAEHAALRRLAPVDANARARLEQIDAETAAGGATRTMRLMYESPDRWRLNQSRQPKMVVDYSDTATNGRTKWMLTDRNLQLAGHSDRVDQFAVESGPAMIRFWMSVMTTGVAWPRDAACELLSVSPGSGGTMLYKVRVGEDRTYRLTVDHHESASDARARLVERDRSGSNGDFVPVARVEDWRWNAQLSQEVAHRYEMVRRAGPVEATISLREIGPLRRDMAQLTAVPASDGDDPFRGAATFTSVIDRGRGQTMQIDADRKTVAGAIGIERRTGAGLRALGIIGMAAAAVLVVVLVRGRRKS